MLQVEDSLNYDELHRLKLIVSMEVVCPGAKDGYPMWQMREGYVS